MVKGLFCVHNPSNSVRQTCLSAFFCFFFTKKIFLHKHIVSKQNMNNFIQRLYHSNHQQPVSMPDKRKARFFIDGLIHWLFPAHPPTRPSDYELQYKHLELSFHELLCPLEAQLPLPPAEIGRNYWAQLPQIYEKLLADADGIYRFDPAAYSLQEVIAAYPGFYAIAVYRLSHPLYQLNIPILPRLFAEYSHSQTGIDIHPGATIGDVFFIDHGTGLVVGETAHIGNNVKIYQGVTLGALNVEKGLAQKKRHPTIEDNVILYAGSTVLGGQTVIGAYSVIGGNVWLTESVPPYSVVYHKSEVRIRSGNEKREPMLDFVI